MNNNYSKLENTGWVDNVKKFFRQNNNKSDESYKYIASELVRVYSYDDLSYLLKSIRREPQWLLIESFGIKSLALFLFVLMILLAKGVSFIVKKLLLTIEAYNNLGQLNQILVDGGILLIIFVTAYIFLRNTILKGKYERLNNILIDILLGSRELGMIDVVENELKERENKLKFTPSDREIRKNMPHYMDQYTEWLKIFFDLLCAVFMVRTLIQQAGKGFDILSWILLIFIVILYPFAYYQTCGEEKKASIRSKLGIK
jgi:hypothetical protein